MSARLILKSLLSLCAIGALSVLAIALLSLPPTGTGSQIIVIPKGASLSSAADILVSKNIVRSSYAFQASAMLFGGRAGIKAGSYLFDQPQSAFRVAKRLVAGAQGLPPIKVTVPEGSDSTAVAGVLAKSISGFDVSAFLDLARPDEGYLFPDTYFFYMNTTPEQAVAAMRQDFDSRTAAIATTVVAFEKKSGVSASDILKMASIVEKEATSSADRALVAGILWKRIKSDMPLQVDPPFAYFLGKDTSKLTLDDLKTESPYNLYTHKGLPPTPIDNPGIDAILATIGPKDSSYWFYLSDARGAMHYASTLEGHIANRQKYLGK